MNLARNKLRWAMKLFVRQQFFPKEKQYLEKQFVGRLATARDNMPHVIPVWYALKSDKIYIDTARNSKKTRNVLKNRRVAFVIDDYVNIGGIKRPRGILIEGQAEILQSGENYNIGRKSIQEKYGSAQGYQVKPLKNRVIIVIHPEKILGWGL